MNVSPNNIILAGFMGTGKTTVGMELSRRLGWKFVDADHLIEARAGRPISRVFEEEGEAGFRRIEREVLEGLGSLTNHVIATGGGAVASEENRRLLEQTGRLILLTATEETIWERVRHARHRPLLAGDDPRGKIRELLEARREAYGAIPLQVPTDDQTIKSIVEAILHRLDIPSL